MWNFFHLESRIYCVAEVIEFESKERDPQSHYLLPSSVSPQEYFLPDVEGVGTLHTMCHHFVVMKPRKNSAESSLEVFLFKVGSSSLLQTWQVPYQLESSLDFYCVNDTDFISFYDPTVSELGIFRIGDPELVIRFEGLKTPAKFNLTLRGPRGVSPQTVSFQLTDADNLPLSSQPITKQVWHMISSNWLTSVVYAVAALMIAGLGYLIFCTKTCDLSTRTKVLRDPGSS